MKVTKLNRPDLLLSKLQYSLKQFGIELYNIELTRSSVKFRAKRLFNKPYYAGGTKFGNPVYSNIYYTPKSRKLNCLHWEEWAIINDLINDICSTYQLGGKLRSYFEGAIRDIRSNNRAVWTSPLDNNDIDLLLEEAQLNLNTL